MQTPLEMQLLQACLALLKAQLECPSKRQTFANNVEQISKQVYHLTSFRILTHWKLLKITLEDCYVHLLIEYNVPDSDMLHKTELVLSVLCNEVTPIDLE